MGLSPGAHEEERQTFQRFLDNTFPVGALCAVIRSGDLAGDTTQIVSTGRVLCTGARRSGQDWEHELLIDPKGSGDALAESLQLWVRGLRQAPESPKLWECVIDRTASDEVLFRLNADPPSSWRPSSQMREAVSLAHPEC
ncbi:hypothetical protein ACFLRH_03060 [Actinomycetota bacterium]